MMMKRILKSLYHSPIVTLAEETRLTTPGYEWDRNPQSEDAMTHRKLSRRDLLESAMAVPALTALAASAAWRWRA
jgi:hypothetical protein